MRISDSKHESKNDRLDIDRLRFVFQDMAITVESLPNTDLLSELQDILITLAQNFDIIMQAADQHFRLFEIYTRF